MSKIVVLITAGSEAEAAQIAKGLVEQQLVACVNILPGIRSFFHWEGKVTEENEFLLIAKTIDHVFEQVVEAVKSAHSYSTPEVIALPIQHGLPEYLGWIESVIQSPKQTN